MNETEIIRLALSFLVNHTEQAQDEFDVSIDKKAVDKLESEYYVKAEGK